MKIITSHERTDMDALASMYAARLLYAGYEVVLPHKLNRNVREMVALHRDQLGFVEASKMPRRRISDLVLVDTQAIAPLRGTDSQTRVTIVDHHPLEGPLGENRTYEGEPLGATTTLLAERLRQQGLTVDRLGASMMLMGIYEDTGSLSYGATTPRDVHAAAWLFDQDADLSLVHAFLNRPLSSDQRDALNGLIAHSTLYDVHGRSICISTVVLDHYVDELSTLIHQLEDLYEPEACFLLAEHRRNIQVIARSTSEAVDVANLLRDFGGGGHKKAAAGLISDASLDDLVPRLLQALEREIEPPLQVREIMSTNVHTLDPNISVRDAVQMMQRYGHEGFPVVDGERLVGVLTRRDTDRAVHHLRGEMPVRSILYTGPLFVHPQDSVDEVRRVMIEHDVGQVPVVEDGRFVGIVTRTDLIKLWAAPPRSSRAQEIRDLLSRALPEALQQLLLRVRDVANDLGYSLYIVGGYVRDLLLGLPNLDLDLVVEGDAIHLARKLAGEIGGRVVSHSRFGTAKIILNGDRAQGMPPSLDFVTARTEFYERPSVLPQVERSSIKQDLYRRDFTINTMAICLDRVRYGELLDFYGGERDLGGRRIRVLHNLSFVEDPTRILRAVRFEQRLGFEIEERTSELIDDALELLNHVTGERLRHELYLLLSEAEPEGSLERLSRMGVLEHIHPSLRYSREMSPLFARLRGRFHAWPAARVEGDKGASDTLAYGDDEGVEVHAPTLGLCYLALLCSTMTPDQIQSFSTHLHISRNDARFLHEVIKLRELLNALASKAMLPSGIYRLLAPFSRESRFVLSVLTDVDVVRERLDLYERELSVVAPKIDGHFIRSLGVPPGPVYGEILDRVRDALLDGQIHSREEEEDLARALVGMVHTETR
jgi:tRNA nucleotidyltransferase (CCA-adding enzyme)